MKYNELILLLVLGVLTVPVALLFNDWVGIFLIYASVALLLIPLEFRKDRALFTANIMIIVTRHTISIVNAYFKTVPGAEDDAVGFHLVAQEMVHTQQPLWFTEFGNFEAGARLYARYLAFWYSLLGDSLLVGQTLSVVFYILSSIVFVKLVAYLGLSRWKTHLIVLYGMLPSSVIFGSITLRESYQIFFFLAAVYWVLKFKATQSFLYLILLVIAAILLGLLHNGLVVYSMLFVALSTYWAIGANIRKWTVQTLGLQFVSLILLTGIIFAWLSSAGNMGAFSKALTSGQGAEYTEGYRERYELGRANYDVKLSVSSPVGFLTSAPLVFIYYMFTPFPWQIGNVLDVYAALEGLLRLLLIYHALAAWRRSSGLQRRQYLYLLLVFSSLEFMWSLGTANWGGAIRHHLVAYSILVVLGGPGLLTSLLRLFGKGKGRHSLARSGGQETLAQGAVAGGQSLASLTRHHH